MDSHAKFDDDAANGLGAHREHRQRDGRTNRVVIKRSNKKTKGFGQRDRASRVSEDIFLWYHGRVYCETALSVALQVDGTLRRQLLQKKALILSVCIDISRPSEATAKQVKFKENECATKDNHIDAT